MKTFSADYATAARSHGRRIEIKAELVEVHGSTQSNQRTYYGYDHIQTINIETGSDTGFTVGATLCAKATIQLIGTVSITQYDKIKVSVAFHKVNSSTDEITEWLSLGTFYLDRYITKDNLTTITAFDKMLRLQKNYYPQTPVSSRWRFYLDEIIEKNGINIDSDFAAIIPTTVTITEEIKKGTDSEGNSIYYSYREALGYFASANATNFFFRDDILCASAFSGNSYIYDSGIYEIEIADTPYAITGAEWTVNGQSYALSNSDNYGKIQFVNPIKFSPKEAVFSVVESRLTSLDSYYPCTMTIPGEGWNEVGDYITVVHQNVNKKICISGIKYTIADGAFDETIYSSAESVSQSNYTSGNIPGQTVSPSVAGATATVKLDYITGINFTASGFISSFSDGATTQQNTWEYTTTAGNITALVNQTTGRIIDITNLQVANEFLTASEVDEIWEEVIGDDS